jgi:hypothetical protein
MSFSEIEPRGLDRIKIESQEAALLRYLCQAEGDDAGRAEILSALRRRRFTSVDHQVLFDCLKQLPAGRPEIVAAELPARLVRSGFPDFDLRDYLAGPIPESAEARRILRQWMESGGGKAGADGA